MYGTERPVESKSGLVSPGLVEEFDSISVRNCLTERKEWKISIAETHYCNAHPCNPFKWALKAHSLATKYIKGDEKKMILRQAAIHPSSSPAQTVGGLQFSLINGTLAPTNPPTTGRVTASPVNRRKRALPACAVPR